MTSHDERTLLRGWKEIAAYLGVSVRSAMVFERERGLPVHRQGGSVAVAYREELDDWRRGATVKAEREVTRQSSPFRRLGKEMLVGVLASGLAGAVFTM